ncbi:MAG: hypothetical protein V4557_14525 [Bacteroidota bacterium]
MKSMILAGIICLTTISFKTYAQANTSQSQTEIKKTTKMKEFILVVRLPVAYTKQLPEVNEKWAKLLQKWKADNVYVISFVFPAEGYILSGPEITTKKEFVVANNTRVVSTIVLLATDMEAAIELARACPIFGFGGTVEVREVPQRPPLPGN